MSEGWERTTDYFLVNGLIVPTGRRANLSVSRAESIREFAILPNDFTIGAGELRPTLKVRRSVVHGRYQAVIDSIYST